MTVATPRRLEAARAAVRARRGYRWMALGVVAVGMMLSVVNVSIVNIALPSMAADLGVDVASIGWVVTGFLVTMATLLPIAGRAGDLWGRRRVFVAGVLVCSAASVGCAMSWDAPSLIAFRVLQGVGACAMAPTAFSYAAELFAPEERGAALGVLGGIMGLAPVLSLNLAGVLVSTAGWRSAFWFTPVLGVVVLAGAALVLQEMRVSERRERFDVPGAVLAAVGLVGILLALSRGEAWGWASPATVGCAVLGAAGGAGFILRERRTADPMIDLGLFRLRSLRTANLAAGASSSALFGTLILLPFFLVAVRGFSAVELALAITPVALSFVVVSPLAGRAMSHGLLPSNVLASAALLLAAGGTVFMALTAARASYWWILPGMVALGTGQAAATSAVTTTAISEVPRERIGVASAMPNICRYTGAGLGVAALGAVLHAALPARLERVASAVDPADRGLVADGFRAAMIVATGFLLVAAAAAARMPRQVNRRTAGAA
ncbi:MAG: DHA2 family efflux MFS transporter permease subunit [Thermoleophilia bacterium]